MIFSLVGVDSGAGTAYTFREHLNSPHVFNGFRVARSLVLYVCFVDCCLSFCTFPFGHCVVCSSSIYGFWLSLWYLQTLQCIKPGQWAIIYLCAMGIDFVSFYDFDIWFWNYSDSVVFLSYHFITSTIDIQPNVLV